MNLLTALLSALRALGRFRVPCALREGPSGTGGLNPWIEARLRGHGQRIAQLEASSYYTKMGYQDRAVYDTHLVIRDLGGGRITKDSVIDPDAGLDGIARPGDRVAAGQRLCRIHAATEPQVREAVERLKHAFELSDAPPTVPPLIHETIGLA